MLGLGLDVAGATLLARGALSSTVELARSDTWLGVGPGSVVQRARDCVAGTFGLAALICGFAVQGGAYFVELAGKAHSSTGHHLGAALLGLALALGAFAATYVVWQVSRDRLATRLLVRVVAAHPGLETRRAELERLVRYAKAMGKPVSEQSTPQEKVRCLRQMFRLDVNEGDLAE